MIDQSMGPLLPRYSDPLLEHAIDHRVEWDLVEHAGVLASRRLLIVGATRDPEVPLERHHIPLVDALRNAGATNLTDLVWDTDHAFSDRRIALARATVDWLRSLLAPGP